MSINETETRVQRNRVHHTLSSVTLDPELVRAMDAIARDSLTVLDACDFLVVAHVAREGQPQAVCNVSATSASWRRGRGGDSGCVGACMPPVTEPGRAAATE